VTLQDLSALSLSFLLLCMLPGCKTGPREGQNPGDCTDLADNDLDGDFDCNDSGCAGAPDCQGDDDDSGSGDNELGPCRPVDHLWDPETEPLRLPCERTIEPCNNIDDDLDGFLDPKCGTVACNASSECTMGGLMPDADCHQNFALGPACTWIDGVPPIDEILLCRGVLCPPGLKCVEGDCVTPGDGLPYSPCDGGQDCPINAGCLAIVEEGSEGWCVWFCHDSPCPTGFTCDTSVFENTWTGDLVTQRICNHAGGDPTPCGNPEDEGQGHDCQPNYCPECEDKVDNDGDGLIDCDDPSCGDYCDLSTQGND